MIIPEKLIKYNPVSQPLHPGELFNADIIQRSAQNILVARDLFSCLTVTTIVPSQSAEDIKDGIIAIIQPVRKPGPVLIRMDNAPGNISLKKFPHPELLKLNITIELGDKLNKNSIASVDRAQQELEVELKKLSPEGQKITPGNLAFATQIVNTKIRSQNLSALEIHLSREQITGENLQINDEDIAKAHFENKEKKNYYAQKNKIITVDKGGNKTITVGDKVYINDDPVNSKHTTRQMFLVTKTTDETDEVYIQKIIHSQSADRLAKLSSELLRINVNRLYLATPPKFTYPPTDTPGYKEVLPCNNNNKQNVTKHVSKWSPFPADYDQDSSDDEIDIADALPEVAPAIALDTVKNILQDLLGDLRTPDQSDDSDERNENDEQDDSDEHKKDDEPDDSENASDGDERDGDDEQNDSGGDDDGVNQEEAGGDIEPENDDGADEEVGHENDNLIIPDELIGPTEKRSAAIRAAQSIKEQAESYRREKQKKNCDIEQVDGCYFTPPTSTDVSVASESRKQSETVDNFLDKNEQQDESSLEWDAFHDQRQNDGLAEDVELSQACLPPPSLQLQFSPRHSHDFNRVYTYHGALPIPTAPPLLGGPIINIVGDGQNDSEDERDQRPEKKRKRRKFGFWKKNKEDDRHDRKDGDDSRHARRYHEVRQ